MGYRQRVIPKGFVPRKNTLALKSYKDFQTYDKGDKFYSDLSYLARLAKYALNNSHEPYLIDLANYIKSRGIDTEYADNFIKRASDKQRASFDNSAAISAKAYEEDKGSMYPLFGDVNTEQDVHHNGKTSKYTYIGPDKNEEFPIKASELLDVLSGYSSDDPNSELNDIRNNLLGSIDVSSEGNGDRGGFSTVGLDFSKPDVDARWASFRDIFKLGNAYIPSHAVRGARGEWSKRDVDQYGGDDHDFPEEFLKKTVRPEKIKYENIEERLKKIPEGTLCSAQDLYDLGFSVQEINNVLRMIKTQPELSFKEVLSKVLGDMYLDKTLAGIGFDKHASPASVDSDNRIKNIVSRLRTLNGR